ncbi:MAG: hypothetical protein K6F66_07020 [Pseudobutyrivibrio sp.]|nr:hypothetical protein [Pseudobutyrivibrio sp.]
MKYRKYLLVAVAFSLVALASIKPAMAYFTDSKIVVGAQTIRVGDSELTPPEDTVESMVKTVAITNTGKYDVFVRVKAIYPSGVGVSLNSESSSKWIYNEADGYYYYASSSDVNNSGIIVAVGEKTESIKFDITEPTDPNLTGNDFNVVIVQEATKVLYNSDGSTYADWNSKITSETEASKEQAPTDDNTTSEGGDE